MSLTEGGPCSPVSAEPCDIKASANVVVRWWMLLVWSLASPDPWTCSAVIPMFGSRPTLAPLICPLRLEVHYVD